MFEKFKSKSGCNKLGLTKNNLYIRNNESKILKYSLDGIYSSQVTTPPLQVAAS